MEEVPIAMFDHWMVNQHKPTNDHQHDDIVATKTASLRATIVTSEPGHHPPSTSKQVSCLAN